MRRGMPRGRGWPRPGLHRGPCPGFHGWLIAKGLAEGHAQGFTDGQVQGVAEGKRSIVVNLARSGMPAEEIARVAETDVELIREWIRGQI